MNYDVYFWNSKVDRQSQKGIRNYFSPFCFSSWLLTFNFSPKSKVTKTITSHRFSLDVVVFFVYVYYYTLVFKNLYTPYHTTKSVVYIFQEPEGGLFDSRIFTFHIIYTLCLLASHQTFTIFSTRLTISSPLFLFYSKNFDNRSYNIYPVCRFWDTKVHILSTLMKFEA